MIYRILTIIAVLFIGNGANAQSSMSAAEFEAYFTGKTMYYEQSGQAFGGEQYMENRRVRWSVLDGKCETGEWYAKDKLICFVYDGDPDPKCWSFYQTTSGIRAYFENDRTQTMLYVARVSSQPLMCLGPEVGV